MLVLGTDWCIINNSKTNTIFFMHIECINNVKWLPNCSSSYLSFILEQLLFWGVVIVVINSDSIQTLCAYIFSLKPEQFFGISFSLCMFYFACEWSGTLCTYWQYLIDCNAQKKNTGSKLRFCNLASSIEITYMPVTIEQRRLCEHKIYHIILQEVRKQRFGSFSSDSWCNS